MNLSEKRSRAGKLGAAARWGRDNRDRKSPSANGKPYLKTARPVAKLRQGRTDWYRIENRADDVAEVYIYDEIGYFGITASDFVRELQAIDAGTIELHLNTPGGDVFDGIAIYNALKNHDAEVDVIVDALAASAGSFIAQAGDSIIMTRNATMMIHDASGIVIGNSVDMREMADLLDKMSDNIASIYAERAGGTIADWRESMRTETWYSADEAVDSGLADQVQGAGKDAKDSFDLSVYSYAGRDNAPAPVIHPSTDEVDVDFDQLAAALEGAFA